MIPKEYLGRYEFSDPSINSNKFWHIVFDMSTQTYICSYGRIGTRGHDPIIYDEKTAARKIREKIKKGYSKKEGYAETIGCQSIHFINSLCEG